MNIILIGLNHKTAPVEVREKLALDACSPEAAYLDIKSPSIKEAVFLSTCNRVEVLATTDNLKPAVEEIKAFLSVTRGRDLNEFEHCLYQHYDHDAVLHLFKVASSLDSMVVGEPQILGQLKDSFREATEHHLTGPILNKLLHKSFSTAKRVRSETGIAGHAVSIGYAAVELARKIFGDLSDKKIMLLGAGEMAELTAEHLLTQGASKIIVANRTLARAMELAQRWGGESASLEEVPRQLLNVDIVISSTGAAETVVAASDVKAVQKARRHRPLFFVDIAVPRDIDPGVNDLENVYLYDIDDLESVVMDNRSARAQEAVKAERIVAEEVLAYYRWIETLDAFPTIVALKEKAENIRETEFKKTLSKIEPLTPQQIDALEVMTKAMTHKLIHDPILFIKAAGRHGGKDLNLAAARRVLGLDNLAASEDVDRESSPAMDLTPQPALSAARESVDK